MTKFQPTCDRSGERRKAHYKNLNLPALQHWYHGDPNCELHCLLTKQPGWCQHQDWGTGQATLRFRLDFNHIRQQNRFLLNLTKTKSPGVSVDKTRDPSSLFRSQDLSLWQNRMSMIEFMCCQTVTTEQHKYITQDSAKSHMSLTNFPRETWAWGLQSRENFESFQQTLWQHTPIDYDQFIAMLEDPLARPYYTEFAI
jgi:hypothetical protein